MKINLSRKFLIFNAHQLFLDEFFKEGINYSYSGVDLGLGVIFVTSLDEVEGNSALFLPLFKDDSFLWIAYGISPSDQAILSESQIKESMALNGLQSIETVDVGSLWRIMKFVKYK